jgi:hypothetical protein
MATQLLDQLPLWLLFVFFMVLTLASYEIAFQLGRWWQARQPGDQEGPTDTLVGALLALMAFLLAVTMGMAADRFDTRRGLVLEEANAIGKLYLQADYLPEAEAGQMKALLREYLPLRLAPDDDEELVAALARSVELHAEMWAITDEVVSSGFNPDIMSSFGESMTDIVRLNQTRVTAGVYARVPETVLLLLLVGSALALAMIGYTAGLRGKRGVLSAVVLTVALGIVLMLVIDLDRPQDGLINVSQQPLVDVQRWVIGTEPPV